MKELKLLFIMQKSGTERVKAAIIYAKCGIRPQGTERAEIAILYAKYGREGTWYAMCNDRG